MFVFQCFTFDLVFGPDSKQVDVYNRAARPIIDNVLQGKIKHFLAGRPTVDNVLPFLAELPFLQITLA